MIQLILTAGILNYNNINILSAAYASVPEKKIPTNELPVPWWDDEVKKVIKDRRKALRTLRRSPTIEKKINFMKARAIARRTIKEKRSPGWTEFVQSIDHSIKPGETFHKMGKLRGKYIPKTISAVQDINNPTTLHYDTPSSQIH